MKKLTETEYLLSTEANRKQLLESIEQAERGEVVNYSETEDFKTLLLKGPVMDDEQHKEFLKNRQQFNNWRKK